MQWVHVKLDNAGFILCLLPIMGKDWNELPSELPVIHSLQSPISEPTHQLFGNISYLD